MSVKVHSSPPTSPRTILHLREGAHLPGYRGYSPTRKYRIGETYGNECVNIHMERMSADKIAVKTLPSISMKPKTPIKRELPEATGSNKYHREMNPGYTGYIPRAAFKYGSRYRATCEESMSEHYTDKEKKEKDLGELNHKISLSPRLHSVSPDPMVKEHMDSYRSPRGRPHHLNGQVQYMDKRSFTEAPMPGYRGYVPFIQKADEGLGVRYSYASEQAFRNFQGATQHHGHAKYEPVNVQRHATTMDGPSYSRRLYQPPGMMPKYTGYLPHKLFEFGKTYGNTSRILDVCAHDKGSYGEYVKTADDTKVEEVESPRQWQVINRPSV